MAHATDLLLNSDANLPLDNATTCSFELICVLNTGYENVEIILCKQWTVDKIAMAFTAPWRCARIKSHWKVAKNYKVMIQTARKNKADSPITGD